MAKGSKKQQGLTPEDLAKLGPAAQQAIAAQLKAQADAEEEALKEQKKTTQAVEELIDLTKEELKFQKNMASQRSTTTVDTNEKQGPETAETMIKNAFKKAAMDFGTHAFKTAFPGLEKLKEKKDDPKEEKEFGDEKGIIATERVAEQVTNSNDLLKQMVAHQQVTNTLLKELIKGGSKAGGEEKSVLGEVADALSNIGGGKGGAASGAGKVAPKTGFLGKAGAAIKGIGGVGKLAGGAALGGLIEGVSEYSESGNAGKALSAGGGAMAGGAAGAVLGSLIFPGVGTYIGGMLGSWLGGKAGKGIYDMASGGKPEQSADIKAAQQGGAQTSAPIALPSGGRSASSTPSSGVPQIPAGNNSNAGSEKTGAIGNVSGSASEAMQFFTSKGWTKEQAAGIVGNLKIESGDFSSDVISGKRKGDNGKAVGIAQWHPDRQAMFKSLYGKELEGSSFKDQLEFVNWELNNNNKQAGAKLRMAKDAAEAASIVDQYYERSSGAARAQRVAAANQYAGAEIKPAGEETAAAPSAAPAGPRGGGTEQPAQNKAATQLAAAASDTGNLGQQATQVVGTPAAGSGPTKAEAAKAALGGPATPSAGQKIAAGQGGGPAGEAAMKPAMTTIKTKSGKTAQVGAAYAANFQGFIDDLEATGYKINSIGGYADRANVNNPKVKSYHAMGAAIDINPGQNPNKSTQTDLPPETGALAAKHGLGWGMNWKSVKDPMHFSAAKGEQGSYDIPRGVQVASGEVQGGAASGGGGPAGGSGGDKVSNDPVGAAGGAGGGIPSGGMGGQGMAGGMGGMGGMPMGGGGGLAGIGGMLGGMLGGRAGGMLGSLAGGMLGGIMQPSTPTRGTQLAQASTRDAMDQRSARQGITVNQNTQHAPAKNTTQSDHTSSVGHVEPVDAKTRFKELFHIGA